MSIPLTNTNVNTHVSFITVKKQTELASSLIPVSYTHLDVYKRQPNKLVLLPTIAFCTALLINKIKTTSIVFS